MAIGSALSVGLIGLKAFIVQVQAFISPGLPYFSIIGLPDTSLSEARERVKSACQASGFGHCRQRSLRSWSHWPRLSGRHYCAWRSES